MSKEDKGDDETSPRYKHAKRMAEAEAKRKKDKGDLKILEQYEEKIFDSRGKPKRRLVSVMSNGKKYRTPVFKHSKGIPKL